MQEWKLFLFFMGILFAPAIQAQKLDSTLAIYRSDFQTEKVHLHFDKTAYNKGETVWFKAYIVAGENLSDYSRNFFVDWYNDLGQLTITANPTTTIISSTYNRIITIDPYDPNAIVVNVIAKTT
jgi:hypothetical protein